MRILRLPPLCLLLATGVDAQAPADTVALSPAAQRVVHAAMASAIRDHLKPGVPVCLRLTDPADRPLIPSASLLRDLAPDFRLIRPANCPRTYSAMGGYVGPGAVDDSPPAGYRNPFWVLIAFDPAAADTMAPYRLRVGQGDGGEVRDCVATMRWNERQYSCAIGSYVH